jgi:putative oxidoreductase
MSEEEIKELFLKGLDCSQVVSENFSNELGYDKEFMRKMSACFGGGMMRGETCGSVIAALMVIGLKYGHFKEDDVEQKQIMREKSEEFKKKFLEMHESTMCKELLGYDLSKPEELGLALESGRLFDFCPKLTKETIDILKEIL